MKKKNNFFKNAIIIAIITLALSATMFMSSCSNDDGDTPVVIKTTKVDSLVGDCRAVLASIDPADYTDASIATLNTKIADIVAAKKTATTQIAMDALAVQLAAAKTVFLASCLSDIPASALLFGLAFDEGTGASLTTSGTKQWTAVLTKGPSEIFGTATNLPSFIDGKKGKAMYFNNGSHLEISNYTATDLLSTKLSIAVWVKLDSTRAGNYIMSYNYWNSWKFQIQELNKPFFTVITSKGGVDADNEGGGTVANKTWTHVVISMDLSTSILDIYINGINTKHWTITGKPNLMGTVKPYATVLPLMIGSCTTYAEANTWTWSWSKTPKGWDHLVGAMDELKVYNVALTAGQVGKLYKNENK